MTGPESVDDAALLHRVARGDEAAFDELWRRHAPWLLTRLRRRAPAEAADLLQETFLAAWRTAGGFRGEDAGGWLWTIASRRLIDAQRRAAVRPRGVSAPGHADPTAQPATTRSTEDEALHDVLDPRLEAAVSRLSPDLAAALQAVVVDGFTTREAALLLGLPEGTVKSRTFRARAFLRERLAHPNRPLPTPGATPAEET